MDRNPLEIAWAAGFADGEGCWHLNWSTDYVPRIGFTLGQGDTRPLERFEAAVGFGKIYGPYRRTNDHWHYRTRGWVQTQALLAMLWPFMSEPKREQGLSKLTEFREHRPRKR